jgi:hypothetical protein
MTGWLRGKTETNRLESIGSASRAHANKFLEPHQSSSSSISLTSSEVMGLPPGFGMSKGTPFRTVGFLSPLRTRSESACPSVWPLERAKSLAARRRSASRSSCACFNLAPLSAVCVKQSRLVVAHTPGVPHRHSCRCLAYCSIARGTGVEMSDE